MQDRNAKVTLCMKLPSDPDLFKLIEEKLFTAVVGDILDRENCWHQFLPQPIKPLDASLLVGR
jgi:4-hydroxy-4-methyl-2-oxoglutarate aldolase